MSDRDLRAARKTIMLKRAILIAMVLCAPVLASGCLAVQMQSGGKTSMSLVWPGSAMPSTPPIPSDATVITRQLGAPATISSGPAKPGDTQASGSWKVQVESTEMRKRLPDGARPGIGQQLLVVNVTIQNAAASNALVVRADQFQLLRASGELVRLFPTRLPGFNAQEVRPIDAGMGRFTQFVYAIPADGSHYTFVVTPGQGATGSMRWTVP